MNRAERQQLSTRISEIRSWIQIAREVRFLAQHPPVSDPVEPDSEFSDLESLRKIGAGPDLEVAEAVTSVSILFPGRKKYRPGFEAAARITEFHSDFKSSKREQSLQAAHSRLSEKANREREELGAALTRFESLALRAVETLIDAAHMPVSRTEVLSQGEQHAMKTVIDLVDLHAAQAKLMLNPGICVSGGRCPTSHASARMMVNLARKPRGGRPDGVIDSAAQRVAQQSRREKDRIRKLSEQISLWRGRADAILGVRAEAHRAVTKRLNDAYDRGVVVQLQEPVTLVALTADDTVIPANLITLRDFTINAGDRTRLDDGLNLAVRVNSKLTSFFKQDWTCHRDGRCITFHDRTSEVLHQAKEMEDLLTGLTPPKTGRNVGLDQITEPTLGLAAYFPGNPRLELLDAALVSRARKGLDAITESAKTAQAAADAAKRAATTVRDHDIVRGLQGMDLEVLRKAATSDRVRVAPLTAAGLNSVWDVIKRARSKGLSGLPGLGEASAVALEQAAHRLFEVVREETPVRIDVKVRASHTTALLQALRRWHALRQFSPTPDEAKLAGALQRLFARRRGKVTHVLCLHDPMLGAPSVVARLNDALARSAQSIAECDVWTDFLSRPADYFGMLTELGFLTEDEQNMHGDLPDEIIKAVRDKELKRDHLTASLRTYQSFGARFVLVQEKVVIGDEMGLGKTIEALAVLAHLRAIGQTHFLVVCPAAVVSNWMRETAKHTTLTPHRLHGPMWERTQAAKTWQRKGGVAITTYDLLGWAKENLRGADIGGAVFDEAHYIKNPSAKRSVAAATLMNRLKYVMLMSGTPLENSVQEFRNLIGYIRPDLSEKAPEYLASVFRKHVAPAYLRRNQEDVLTELPELVETDEWLGMSETDEAEYRRAVADGHFMQMRRAAMLSDRSLKVQRLQEIVEEAEANGRQVIVFSFFREVLDLVARQVPGKVFGPLTGSMPANNRQTLIDRFSAAGGGAVLVSQITAGGVGLNIQSASVIVICEPQLKPTMEAQAIARAHRMGQTNKVQVHRLLSENRVDERIRDILAEKRQLFDEFARESVIASRAPDAVDVSDAELARQVVAAERERLFGQTWPSSRR